MPVVQVRETDCAEPLDPWSDRADPETGPGPDGVADESKATAGDDPLDDGPP